MSQELSTNNINDLNDKKAEQNAFEQLKHNTSKLKEELKNIYNQQLNHVEKINSEVDLLQEIKTKDTEIDFLLDRDAQLTSDLMVAEEKNEELEKELQETKRLLEESQCQIVMLSFIKARFGPLNDPLMGYSTIEEKYEAFRETLRQFPNCLNIINEFYFPSQ